MGISIFESFMTGTSNMIVKGGGRHRFCRLVAADLVARGLEGAGGDKGSEGSEGSEGDKADKGAEVDEGLRGQPLR